MTHPSWLRLRQSEIEALENHPISNRQFWERYGHPEGVTPTGEADHDPARGLGFIEGGPCREPESGAQA